MNSSEHSITIETFFKLLHDSANDGFSIRYRRTDGTLGERHGCGKPRRQSTTAENGGRIHGKKTKLAYDVLEKGVVLLQDEKGEAFSLRNRLLVGYRFVGQNQWYRIKHTW